VTARALRALQHEFDRTARVRVVAVGKAAAGMAKAATEHLGDRFIGGVATIGAGRASEGFDHRWQLFPSGHPLPNVASEAAGRAALALAAEVRRDDELLLVCLSGGASAMLAVPAEGLTLDDKRVVNEQLLRAGLDIGAMNVVRRHLSAIKGGQLAAAAARSITLAISDVIKPVEDDPLTIGSGPTVADATTFAEALAVVEGAGIGGALPPAAMRRLERGDRDRLAGPVPPGDPRLRQAAYWLVGSRQDGMRAAADTARQLGYHVRLLPAPIGGEARLAPSVILDEAREAMRPVCVISSGETTVRVKGTGRGGRNQELAVAALERLETLRPAALASVGSDGVDGPTDAAGALVDSEMWGALGAGAETICAAALENTDVYPLLDGLGALVKTGPTGTNVGDLQVLLVG
jgi:glycerate 2-kinase